MHRHLKTAFFYLFCLLTGVGAAYCVRHLHGPSKPAATSGDAAPPVHRGLTFLPPENNATSTAFWQDACQHIKAVHGTALLTYVGPWIRQQVNFPANAAKVAHEAGLKAELIYQQDLSPKVVSEEFARFRVMAATANSAGFDTLLVGPAMSDPDESADSWQALIPALRQEFHNEFAFLATPDNYYFIPWWNLVDTIAISGPLPLPRKLKITPHELELAWQSQMTTLTSFAAHNSKPLLLLNLGVAPSPDLQSSNLSALLRATAGQSDLHTLFLHPDLSNPANDSLLSRAWQGKP